MDHYLVINALGADKTGLIEDLTKAATDNRCNIMDSRMAVFGSEFSLSMLVSGTWDAIAKLEAQLPSITKKLDLSLISKRTQLRAPQNDGLPYHANVVALDNLGLITDIAGFFSRQAINIESMETSTYPAAHTGCTMFNLDMTVSVPTRVHVAALRESFMAFCDDRNLDSCIEPFRP